MEKQTAVEWLVSLYYTEYGILLPSEDYEQAKQMEKEQIVEAWQDDKLYFLIGEHYYEETYGK